VHAYNRMCIEMKVVKQFKHIIIYNITDVSLDIDECSLYQWSVADRIINADLPICRPFI